MVLNKVQFSWKLGNAERWDGNFPRAGCIVNYSEVLILGSGCILKGKGWNITLEANSLISAKNGFKS